MSDEQIQRCRVRKLSESPQDVFFFICELEGARGEGLSPERRGGKEQEEGLRTKPKI